MVPRRGRRGPPVLGPRATVLCCVESVPGRRYVAGHEFTEPITNKKWRAKPTPGRTDTFYWYGEHDDEREEEARGCHYLETSARPEPNPSTQPLAN